MSDAELQTLLDERAIVALTHAYCWALDRREYHLLDAVFLDQAVAVLGGRECHGLHAIMARIDEALTPLDDSQHMISNHEVRINGDAATCRCYLQAQHIRRAAEGGPNYIVAGRYEDRLRRTADGWRIEHRVLTTMWTDGNVRVVRPTA